MRVQNRSGHPGSVRTAIHANLVAAIACLTLLSSARAQDIGIEGFSHFGSNADPSGSKPESKLWFHAGLWWGSMWNTAKGDFYIHRLDPSTQTWIDTGTLIDTRKNGRADVLWDGSKLYIASHYYSPRSASGYPTWFSRYSYISQQNGYQLDPGFPVQINNYKIETVVIDKDSTGTIWATWVQSNTVYVTHTLGSDNVWGVPYVLPTTTITTSDDISSLIHFNGDRIGVCWSDQVTLAFWFSYHLDGTPDTTWSPPESMLAPGSTSDDHINLKTDSLGQVYSAVKSDGAVKLLIRRPDATWNEYVACIAKLNFTRPIVELNQEAGELYFVASTSGTTYLKTSPLFNISFPDGYGTPLMRDADVLVMDNPSSTKQDVSSSTGLVILATSQSTKKYWHSVTQLTPPGPPVASFSADPTVGEVPLEVQFNDTSTGAPSSWFWNFGDGDFSTEQHPAHTYTAEGTYSVMLSVGNDFGDDSELQTDLISVGPPPSFFTFVAVEDSKVKSTSPNNNYGSDSTLRVRKTSTEEYRSYLKFEVSGVPGTITGATLRLYVTDGSPDGGTAYLVDNQWTETTITWNIAPPISGSPLDSFGEVLIATIVELDLSSAVLGNGTYSFALTSADSNSAYYSSSESSPPPELVITYQ